MPIYSGTGNRATKYLGMQSSPLPYIGAGILFAGDNAGSPTYVGATPLASGTGAITPTFASTGRVSGDYLILFVESANQAVSTPSGWNLFPSTPQSTGTAATVGGVRLTSFWKVSDGTETTVSIADSGDHTTAAGIVVRGVDTTSYTNLLQNSTSFTNGTYWHTFGGHATIATSAVAGPDGVTTACRLTVTGATGVANDTGIYTDSYTTLTANTTYTLSAWVRAVSGTAVFSLGHYETVNGGDSDGVSADFTATTTWQKFVYTFRVANGTVTYSNAGIFPGSALANCDLYITDFQLETGSTASPSLRTSTAAISSIKGIANQTGKAQSATTSISFLGLDAPVDNCFVVNALANDRDAASTSNLSAISNSSLTNLTLRVDETVTSGFGGGIAVITGNKVRAGAVSGTTATNALSVTNANMTIVLAPKPILLDWTPIKLITKPLIVVDPSTFTWSGSNFSSGTNAGSIGGTFTTAVGTPTKASADINGYDAITFAATSGIGISSASKPSGNVCVFYVYKTLGTPNNNLGAIMSQPDSTPGWAAYAQINTTTTLSNGHNVVPGNIGALGWPSGTTNLNKDVIANPPTDDNTYHIVCQKIGTSHLVRYDGTELTPTYASDNTIDAITGNIYIGTSYGSQHLNANVAYALLLQDPTTEEIQKLEGWAAWKFGLVSKLPIAHMYKNAPPTNGPAPLQGWNTNALEASGMTFSNSNRTIVGNNGGVNTDTRCISAASIKTGKMFASVSIDAREYFDISIADSTDTNYTHYSYDGGIYSSTGGTLATIGTYTAPCVIDIAFDADAHLVWFRVNGGNWNGNASYNPSSGTGGYAVPSSTLPYHVKVNVPVYNNAQRTINTGTVAWTYSPPSGFSALFSG